MDCSSCGGRLPAGALLLTCAAPASLRRPAPGARPSCSRAPRSAPSAAHPSGVRPQPRRRPLLPSGASPRCSSVTWSATPPSPSSATPRTSATCSRRTSTPAAPSSRGTAGRSRSSSGTPSWRCGASRWPTRTTPSGRCAPASSWSRRSRPWGSGSASTPWRYGSASSPVRSRRPWGRPTRGWWPATRSTRRPGSRPRPGRARSWSTPPPAP